MKGFAIVYPDNNTDHILITSGALEDTDIKGYEGILIRRTVYKAVRVGWVHRLVLWLLKRWSHVDIKVNL